MEKKNITDMDMGRDKENIQGESGWGENNWECRCLKIPIENLKHQVDHFIFSPKNVLKLIFYPVLEGCERKSLATYPAEFELFNKLLIRSICLNLLLAFASYLV